MWNRIYALLALSLMVPSMAYAVAPQWAIVPADSTLTFTAVQNNSPVTGRFTKFAGTIAFDPAQLDSSAAHIVVDMGSVDTTNGEVLYTIKGSEWFATDVFPQAVFDAKAFTQTGDNTYEAPGTLTIRDKTVPTVLHFTVNAISDNETTAKGSVTIKRNDFGVGQGVWTKTDSVKDEVLVEFTIHATK